MYNIFHKMADRNYRVVSIQYMASVSIIMLTPMIFFDIWQGDYNMAAALAILVFGLIGVVYWCDKYEVTFESIQWVVTPLLSVIVGYAVQTLGFKAMLWVYPSIIVFFIAMPMKNALVFNLLFIAVFTVIGQELAEPQLLIRFFITSLSVYFLVAIFVTVIDRQQQALHTSAETDPLTGLLNRSTLYESLAEAINQHSRADLPMTLIAIDLDFFKNVNDEFGHDVGDEVLRDASKLFSNESRVTDKFFRLGGEEFLILLFNTTGEEGATKAEQLRKQLLAYGGYMPTASFGVAEYLKGETPTRWLKRSDTNLYKAKELGRNKVITD